MPSTLTVKSPKMLLAALADIQPNDVIELEPMVAQVDVQITIPDNVTLKSRGGPERTVLTSSYQYQADTLGCSIELGDQAVVDGIRLRCVNASASVQLVAIGFGVNAKQKRSATIRNSIVETPEWGPYAWAKPIGHSLLLEGNRIYSGWQCATWGDSSGGSGQMITSRGNQYFAGLVPSRYVGAISNQPFSGKFAMVARGGRVASYDDVFTVYGASGVPRACGVTTWFDGGSPETLVELHRPTIRVNGLGSNEVFDVDQHGLGTIKIFGGSGSGPGGAFLVNGKVEVNK